MAHDFLIRKGLIKQTHLIDVMMAAGEIKIALFNGQRLEPVPGDFRFFGYCGGLVYRAFNCQGFDGGSSGKGLKKAVNKEQLLDGICLILGSDLFPSEDKEVLRKYVADYIEPASSSSKFTLVFS